MEQNQERILPRRPAGSLFPQQESTTTLADDSIPGGNPLVKTGIWADQLGSHPILFGSKAHLQALAASNSPALTTISKCRRDRSRARQAFQTSGEINIVRGGYSCREGLDPTKVTNLINASPGECRPGPLQYSPGYVGPAE